MTIQKVTIILSIMIYKTILKIRLFHGKINKMELTWLYLLIPSLADKQFGIK